MRVLGIETTCDETAAAVVRLRHDGCGEVLSDEVMSQISQHSAFGGVVPEIAARAHVELIDGLVTRALRRAGMTAMEIDGVAAAAGPGLIGAVLVGLMTGKGIALATGKPFIAVNHLEAHALTPRLTERLTFPYLLLLASGGHSQWLGVRGVGDYVRLGATLDDAIGEAFDKTARLLGLPYPGGPAIEIAARSGDGERFDFPRPMMGRPNADFSLSGLKTAVRHAVAALNGSRPLRDNDIADVAASFQAAVVDVIEDRLRVAMRMFRASLGAPHAVVIAGGVGANGAIRAMLAQFCAQSGLPLVAPPVKLCTDNGAMIAWAGVERLRINQTDSLDAPARPRWPLDPNAGRSLNGKA